MDRKYVYIGGEIRIEVYDQESDITITTIVAIHQGW